MTENLKYEGEWFLPAVKENKISGILTFNINDGCSLTLHNNSTTSLMSAFGNIDIIQGVLSNGKYITLYRCTLTKIGNKNIFINGATEYQIIECSAQYILEGALINTTEEMIFQKVASKIFNLDEWVGVSGFAQPFMPKTTDYNTFEIQYVLPETISFPLKDDLQGQFEFLVETSGHNRYQKSMSLTQKINFVLSSKSGITLDEVLNNILIFQNFIMIALYNKSYPLSISLFSDNFSNTNNDKRRIATEIKIYFSVPHNNNTYAPKCDSEMLFCYNKIKNNFPALIKKWFDIYEEIQPVLSLIIPLFFNNEQPSVNSFLNIAQAAESFHARLNSRTKIPRSEYKIKIEKICESVPSEYREWIKTQLEFGNELTLDSRLNEIITKCSNPILDKVIEDKATFVKQIKWSRNYYTHYSIKCKKNALKGQKLHDLTSRLKLVLVCALLNEIGIENKQIESFLREHEYYVTNFYSI